MKKWLLISSMLVVLIISSSMTYEQQTIIPSLETILANKPFEEQLSYLHIPYWNTIVSVQERGYFKFVEFLIRKATHFIGFGCIALAILYILPNRLRQWGPLLAIGLTAFIALLDEIRQSFTPGRTMSMQDVALDTAGAVFFIFIVLVSRKLVRQFRR